MPPHARAVSVGRGHRFAAYPRCSADLWLRKGRGKHGADLAGTTTGWLHREVQP
jgi:hypothetical protein